MFEKVLIANRGEIACRILRTAKRMGIHSIAVYSDADVNAMHVKMADEAWHIGQAPSRDSYLNIDKLIQTAKQSGAQAIHPGYGFLAENATFASACQEAGIYFIGPPVEAIRAMGSKVIAKRLMQQAAVPMVPGYLGDKQDLESMRCAAAQIGYPILLKAAAGGGGKGMRTIRNEKEFADAYTSAKREALASFNDDTLFIEKYLTKPRHVEIQIFADQAGHYVYLYERDCSLQRRHQKVIEEAPAPDLSEALRKKMGEAAITAARTIAYVGAGTVEFLLDEDDQFYFMEMNTRLQVEHPVTEMITGYDLVEWQFNVAAGKQLPVTQKQIHATGHAFEARIYAEDPLHDFLPATGQIRHLITPTENQHVRIDTGVTAGDVITPYYDPLIAKLIVWDNDRESALRRLHQALANYQIVGLTTNLDFLTRVTEHPVFAAGAIDTGFIAKHTDELLSPPEPVSTQTLALACLYTVLSEQQKTEALAKQNQDPTSPWYQRDAFRLNLKKQWALRFLDQQQAIEIYLTQQAEGGYVLQYRDEKPFYIKGYFLNNTNLHVETNEKEFDATVIADNHTLFIAVEGLREILHLETTDYDQAHDAASGHLTAPMPGTVVALLAKPGETLEKGAGLLVIEAMKMEHTIHAPSAGAVKEFYYQIGDLVQEGVELLDFQPTEEA